MTKNELINALGLTEVSFTGLCVHTVIGTEEFKELFYVSLLLLLFQFLHKDRAWVSF